MSAAGWFWLVYVCLFVVAVNAVASGGAPCGF